MSRHPYQTKYSDNRNRGTVRIDDQYQGPPANFMQVIRPTAQSIKSVHDFTRHTYFQASSNCDGSNPSDTQWIGFITATADTTKDSPIIKNCSTLPAIGDTVNGGVVTVLLVDSTNNTATLSSNLSSTTIGVSFTFTGNAHPYPSAANGFWQFGLNMWPLFNVDGLITPGTIGDTAGVIGQIDILDQAGVSLVTATRGYTFTQTGPGALSCTLALNFGSEPTTPVVQFYGVKFSINGGSFNIGSNWNMANQLVIVDSADFVVDKAFP